MVNIGVAQNGADINGNESEGSSSREFFGLLDS